MTCKHCNSSELYVKDTGTHVGLYCANSMCNKWQQWVGKKQMGNFSNYPHYGVNEQPRLRQPSVDNSQSMGFNDDTQYVDFERHADAVPQFTPYTTQMEQPVYTTQPPMYNQQEPYQQPDYVQQQQYSTPNREAVQAQFSYSTMCVACISGVVPSLGDNQMYTMQYKKDSGLLIMSSKKTSEVVYSASVSHCPVCGASNKKAVV